MKTLWIAGIAIAASSSAFAQSTIYKYVDESGRVTYSNKPMKGAVVLDMEPLTTIPATPDASLHKASVAPDKPEVLMNGPHTIERCEEVTSYVLQEVFDALYEHGVFLEGMVLKPNMVVSVAHGFVRDLVLVTDGSPDVLTR